MIEIVVVFEHLVEIVVEHIVEIRDMLMERNWIEGSNRENGSLLLEKAFVG